MITLACCDDTALERDILKDLLDEYAKIRKAKLNTVLFSSGRELLQSLDANGSYDIFILDMIMPFMNGVEVAAEIHKRKQNALIIFLTATRDYVFEAFGVHAWQYLLKPYAPEQLFAVLDEAIRLLENAHPYLTRVKTRSGEQHLALSDLLYVSLEDHTLCYHMRDGRAVFSLTLRTGVTKAAADVLADGRFAAAGSSLIVNMNEVRILEKGYAVLSDGTELYPPERHYQHLKAAWAGRC